MNEISLFYFLVLFLLTFSGGLLTIFGKFREGKYLGILLAFSGSFLLGITFLHLIPDAVKTLSVYSGILMFLGFFGQQIVQHWTHGMEHGHRDRATGHSHHHDINEDTLFWPVFIGLSIHAFSEGLPLGIHYSDAGTLPSLILAIGLHKVPEAMLVIALFLAKNHSKSKGILLLILFACITPFSGIAATFLGDHFEIINTFLKWCIPLVAGVFIQIATTIFYETSNQNHEMKWQKWLAVIAGLGVALLSLL